VLRGFPENTIGSVRVVAAPEWAAPFEVEAIAREEDTFLVLSADPTVRDPGEPLMKVLTAALESEPQPPGSVVVRPGRPLELLAVVHDLALDPTWKEEWVVLAIDAVLAETRERELRSIAVPPLGAVHGTMAVQRFVALLAAALRRGPTGRLERLWIVAAEADCEIVAGLRV
jgi:hypothetical protein